MAIKRYSEDCRWVFGEHEKYFGPLIIAADLEELLHQIISKLVHHQLPNVGDNPSKDEVHVLLPLIKHPLQEPASLLILGH